MYTVEFYSRKPLWQRRQHYWHLRFKQGAIDNIIADSGEGYNNADECRRSWDNLCKAIKAEKVKVVIIK